MLIGRRSALAPLIGGKPAGFTATVAADGIASWVSPYDDGKAPMRLSPPQTRDAPLVCFEVAKNQFCKNMVYISLCLTLL